MDKRVFEHYEKLFDSPGWSRFIEDVMEKRDSLETNTLTNINTERELWASKGLHAAYSYVIAFESMIRQSEEAPEELN